MINKSVHNQFQIPIVRLASGDKLNLVVHHFVGKKPGKKVYIQANLHGPEVVGIGVILKLKDLLMEKGIGHGEVKVVISANPIGLNMKIGGYQVGYKNMNSAKYPNWNRIFKVNAYQTISTYGVQIEDKLASVIQNLSHGFKTALDLHSAQNNIEAAYTFNNGLNLVRKLGVPNVVLLKEQLTGCFDEAFYFNGNKKTKVVTLELSGNQFGAEYITYWAEKIYGWLIGKICEETHTRVWNQNEDKKYFATTGGLVIPHKKPGEIFKKGETLTEILTVGGKTTLIKANLGGLVFKVPLVQVVSEGEEVIQVFEKGAA